MKVKAKHISAAYAVTRAAQLGESISVDKLSMAMNVLFQAGLFDEGRAIAEHLISMLKRFLQENKVEKALVLETLLYRDCIKLVETEENHHFWFSRWAMDFGQVALESPLKRYEFPTPRLEASVGFVLHSGLKVLGHTTVMLGFLKQVRLKNPSRRLVVFALDVIGDQLREELELLGVEGVGAIHDSSLEEDVKFNPLQRIIWLQNEFLSRHLHVAIWVSTFQWAHFSFGVGLAARQVFWAMKFHSFAIGSDVVHVGFGHPTESSRNYFDTHWYMVPWPLTTNYLNPNTDVSEILRIRSEFNCKVLFGTLAREEKLDQVDYAVSVCLVLEDNPEAHFIYTGRTKSSVLEREFTRRNLMSRVHFIGWVDTSIYSGVLDIFLETFPLGCAITGFQSMFRGKPFVSIWRDGTVSKELLRDPVSVLTEHPETLAIGLSGEKKGLVVARSSAEYVRYATYLARNDHERKIAGERCRSFVDHYGDGEILLAKRMLEIIDGH